MKIAYQEITYLKHNDITHNSNYMATGDTTNFECMTTICSIKSKRLENSCLMSFCILSLIMNCHVESRLIIDCIEIKFNRVGN